MNRPFKTRIERELCSAKEASEITGYTKSAIFNMIRTGRLDAAYVGGIYLIARVDLGDDDSTDPSEDDL